MFARPPLHAAIRIYWPTELRYYDYIVTRLAADGIHFDAFCALDKMRDKHIDVLTTARRFCVQLMVSTRLMCTLRTTCSMCSSFRRAARENTSCCA